MDDRTKQGNLVRAFNLAGEIVAGGDVSDLEEVVEKVKALTDALYVAQNEAFESEGLGEDTRPKSDGKKSWGGSKKSSGKSSSSNSDDGPSSAQKNFFRKLVERAGEDSPYDALDISEMTKKEASEAISELKDGLGWD